MVIVSNKSGLAQEITAGKHLLRADEPSPLGTDSGPSPYDLLLASLGACTSMTLRLYAQRKSWDLQHVTVQLRYYRIHSDDCHDCDTKIRYLDRIDREIHMTGNLDTEQRERLREIAGRCPVARTLQSEIDIRTTLV